MPTGQDQRRLVDGPRATGVSAGTFLVGLAKLISSKYPAAAQFFVFIAPFSSVAVDAMARYYVDEYKRNRDIKILLAKIDDEIKSPLTSQERKASLQEIRDKVNDVTLQEGLQKIQISITPVARR